MLRIDPDTLDCEIVYGKDSEENTVSILWLIPQYTIITIGEVLNSATAGEFVYTQIGLLIYRGAKERDYPGANKIENESLYKAPMSMKSVVGSFWFLTTCFGNILDIFFVEIKLHPTQV